MEQLLWLLWAQAMRWQHALAWQPGWHAFEASLALGKALYASTNKHLVDTKWTATSHWY